MDANRVSGRLVRQASAAALAFCAVGLSFPCLATLGGDLSTVEQDRTHLKASLSVSPSTGYSVHELKAATGTAVREYATADGRVFGVAWEGPWRPDLRQLLGDYFPDYQRAARNKRQRSGLNGPLMSSTSRLVIEMSGRPRAFYGRAYLPDLVPSGIEPNGIR